MNNMESSNQNEFWNSIVDFVIKPVVSVAVITIYIKILWEVAKFVWNLI